MRAKIDINKVVMISFLTVMSLIIAYISRIFFNLPCFHIELSDSVAYAVSGFYGPLYGFIILVIVSFMRMFLFSFSGWAGLFFRLFSIVGIYIMYAYMKNKNLLILIFGTILYTIIRVPINMLFWNFCLNISFSVIKKMIYVLFISNFIKISLNFYIGIHIFNLIKRSGAKFNEKK